MSELATKSPDENNESIITRSNEKVESVKTNLDVKDIDKLEYDFVTNGIFERRRNQYSFLLYYLAFSGIWASIITSIDDPARLIPLLAIPIFIGMPLYLEFVYQRLEIDKLDKTRSHILGDHIRHKSWQPSDVKYINDFLIAILVPLSLTIIAIMLEWPEYDNSKYVVIALIINWLFSSYWFRWYHQNKTKYVI